MNIFRITLISIIFLTASCADKKEKEYDTSDWIGQWHDGTGYWIKIEMKEGSTILSRSGERKDSPTTFKNIEWSDNNKILKYEELSDYLHYIHTLKRVSGDEIIDEWFDVETAEIWQTTTLTR